jgi:DNA-binding MarR family transcriptional regulator
VDTTGELAVRLHELIAGVRRVKQRHTQLRSALPVGAIGMLLQIDRHSTGCHASELAGHTGLDPSTVSRAVASLVAHGLVERQPDPADRRASVLAITPSGRAALAETFDWYGRLLDRTLAGWTAAEVAALGAALDRFTRDLENTLTHPNPLEAAR